MELVWNWCGTGVIVGRNLVGGWSVVERNLVGNLGRAWVVFGSFEGDSDEGTVDAPCRFGEALLGAGIYDALHACAPALQICRMIKSLGNQLIIWIGFMDILHRVGRELTWQDSGI